MTMTQQATPAGRRTVRPPLIREHRIPTDGSKPYIAVEGRDGCLWFCESGTSRIGRLDPNAYRFTEFALPTANATPIGIVAGPDGNLWFAEKSANQIGRITPRGEITEFPLPTPNAGPDAMQLGPDGNLWFSETEASQIGRITPDGADHRIQGRDYAALQAALHRGARRRALVQRGRRQPDRPHHDGRQGH